MTVAKPVGKPWMYQCKKKNANIWERSTKPCFRIGILDVCSWNTSHRRIACLSPAIAQHNVGTNCDRKPEQRCPSWLGIFARGKCVENGQKFQSLSPQGYDFLSNSGQVQSAVDGILPPVLKCSLGLNQAKATANSKDACSNDSPHLAMQSH